MTSVPVVLVDVLFVSVGLLLILAGTSIARIETLRQYGGLILVIIGGSLLAAVVEVRVFGS